MQMCLIRKIKCFQMLWNEKLGIVYYILRVNKLYPIFNSMKLGQQKKPKKLQTCDWGPPRRPRCCCRPSPSPRAWGTPRRAARCRRRTGPPGSASSSGCFSPGGKKKPENKCGQMWTNRCGHVWKSAKINFRMYKSAQKTFLNFDLVIDWLLRIALFQCYSGKKKMAQSSHCHDRQKSILQKKSLVMAPIRGLICDELIRIGLIRESLLLIFTDTKSYL